MIRYLPTPAALLIAAFAAFAASGQAAAAAAPNIVVIMTDDQTVADLAVMPHTPQLLAANGVTFSNSFVDNPLCCPSRATFLTGQAAHNHGIIHNIIVENGAWMYGYAKFQQLGEAETLPVWLQRAGFATFYFGKYMNGYGADDPAYVPPGWSRWFGKPNHSAYQFYDYDLNENGRIVHYGCGTNDYETDVAGRKAAAFIRTRGNAARPFFMWIAPLAPHGGSVGSCQNYPRLIGAQPAERHRGLLAASPLDQPPAVNEANISDKPSWLKALPLMNTVEMRQARMRQNNRREALLAVDEMVQRLYFDLSAIGQLENTCIIFTSDNGYMIGHHRAREGKMLPYEESIRVPLIISCPGMPAGAVRDQMVNNTDLVATILDLAGATAGREPDGKSLLPIIADASAPWRQVMLLQGAVPGTLIYHPYEDAVAQPLIFYKAVRCHDATYCHDAKYVEYDNGEREFYYLGHDAGENVNRVDDPATFPRIKVSLKKALDLLRNCKGVVMLTGIGSPESCWMATVPPAP
ncbi:MAG: N-acetylglucosamine-6-sulfatase, partial [Alphaproteobacteria bacterium]|nr:N-acetylglucosamine-6-sulfatase [Alphaproteobacteria bacterium]